MTWHNGFAMMMAASFRNPADRLSILGDFFQESVLRFL